MHSGSERSERQKGVYGRSGQAHKPPQRLCCLLRSPDVATGGLRKVFAQLSFSLLWPAFHGLSSTAGRSSARSAQPQGSRHRVITRDPHGHTDAAQREMADPGPDPRLEGPPDFAAPRWTTARNGLKARHPNASDEQIEEMVQDIAAVELDIRVAEWEEKTAAFHAHQAQQPVPPPQLGGGAGGQGAIPFPPLDPNNLISSKPITRIHPFASFCLKKRVHVGLWYFTADGLEEAANLPASAFASLFYDGVLDADDKNRVPPESRRFIPDKDLPWREWSIAKTAYITALQEYGWPKQYLDMYFTFFATIESHGLRSQEPILGDLILTDYLHNAHIAFHASLARGTPSFIAKINEDLLEDSRRRITKADELRCVIRSLPLEEY